MGRDASFAKDSVRDPYPITKRRDGDSSNPMSGSERRVRYSPGWERTVSVCRRFWGPDMDATVELDEHDRRLIQLLMVDGRLSYQEMATSTGLSPATVRRRVERLLELGAVRIAAVPQWRRIGLGYSAFVGINAAPAQVASVAAQLATLDEVYWLAMTTGDFELLCEFFLPSADHLSDFLLTHIASVEGIRRFHVMPPTRMIKSWNQGRIPIIHLEE